MKRFLTLLLSVLGGVFAEQGAAQTATTWNFTASANPSTTAPYYTATPVSVGNGLGTVTLLNSNSPSAGYSGASGGNGAAAAALKSTTLNTGSSTYYEVTLTPSSGNSVTVNTLSVGAYATADGPQYMAVRTSADNYATEYAGWVVSAPNTWTSYSTLPMGVASGTNTPLKIRIYGYGSTGTPVTGVANWVLDDLTVDANTTGSGPGLPGCTAPSAVTGAAATAFNATGITATFNASSGATGYVLFTSTTATPPSLVNGTVYNSGNPPPGFTYAGGGSFTNYQISGLAPNTTYYVHAFAYSNTNCGGGPAYSAVATASAATPASSTPCTAPSYVYTFVAGTISNTSISYYIGLNNPANGYLVIRYSGNAPSQPVNGVTYTSGNVGTLGNGLTLVYAGAGTVGAPTNPVSDAGLNSSTVYKYAIWSYNANASGTCVSPSYSTVALRSYTTLGMGENLLPRYMTAKGAVNAAALKTYFPLAVTFTGLSANTVYSAKLGLAATSEAASVYGGGLFAAMNAGQIFSGQTISNAFTTDASGNGTLLAVAQTGDDVGRFVPGQAHQLRIGLWTAMGSAPASPQYLSSGTVTALDIAPTGNNTATTLDDGAFLSSSTSGNYSYGIAAIWSETQGLGRPLATALVLPNSPTQSSQADLPTAVDAIYSGSAYNPGDFVTVFPTTAGGIRRVSFYTASDLVHPVFSSISDAPIAGTAKVTSASRGDVLARDVYAADKAVFNSSVSLPANLQVGLLQLGTSGSLTLGAKNLVVTSELSSYGATIDASGSGTLSLAGSTPLTVPAGLFTSNQVAKLTVANTGGVTLAGPVAVTNTLTLTSGVVSTGSNVLTVGSPSAPGTLAYTGGGVKGTLERYFSGTNSGAATGLFPMLNSNGQQRFATVEFSGAPTTGGKLTATVSESGAGSLPAGTLTVPATGSCAAFNVSSLSNQFVTLSRTAGGGTLSNDGTYDLTLTVQGPLNNSDPCKLTILKRPDAAGAWALAGTQVAPVQNGQLYTLKRTGITTSFSDFVPGGGGTPLEAALLSFTLKQDGLLGLFAWELAAGAAPARQELQESSDGQTFETIYTTTSTAATQSWRYSLPGLRWYRLRLTAADGAVTFSQTVRAAELPQSGATLQPNPAADRVLVKAAGLREVRLYNALGALIQAVPATGTAVSLDLHSLPPGRYAVQVAADVPAVLPLVIR